MSKCAADLNYINKPTARSCLCFRQLLAYLRQRAAPVAAAGALCSGTTALPVAGAAGPKSDPSCVSVRAPVRTLLGSPQLPADATPLLAPCHLGLTLVLRDLVYSPVAAFVAAATDEALRESQREEETQGLRPQHREAPV